MQNEQNEGDLKGIVYSFVARAHNLSGMVAAGSQRSFICLIKMQQNEQTNAEKEL